MAEQSKLPDWRRGWTWTLIKCAAATTALATAATGALMYLLKRLLDNLPDWLPSAWARWLFEWMVRHVWFVGPLVGVILGALVSVGIVLFDARRGRLTRVR